MTRFSLATLSLIETLEFVVERPTHPERGRAWKNLVAVLGEDEARRRVLATRPEAGTEGATDKFPPPWARDGWVTLPFQGSTLHFFQAVSKASACGQAHHYMGDRERQVVAPDEAPCGKCIRTKVAREHIRRTQGGA